MAIHKRSTVDSDGAYCRILEYEGGEHGDWPVDSVVVRVPPESDDTFTLHAYEDNEVVYEELFEIRDLAFDPVTALGRGETNTLTGLSPSDDDSDIPHHITVALQSIGYTDVPNGTWWLDGFD